MTTALTKPDRTQEALAKLEAGLAQLLESDRWQVYLKVQGRFHTYSGCGQDSCKSGPFARMNN